MKAKQFYFIFTFIIVSSTGFSQTVDSTRIIQHFSGTASITNNGISLIPSFSLGKPAVLILMSLGGARFSIDPDMRFGLDGKPWTFLFWARYKLVPQGRFRVNTGAHLGLNHRSTSITSNGATTENLVVRRYLAAELAPGYLVSKTINVGVYYLYSHGLDPGTVRNTHFITLNSNFSRIPIASQLYLRAIPQLYFLKQDGNDGYYFNGTVTLAAQHFPLAISSIINKELKSQIPGSKNFIWNISLNYSFNRNYVPKHKIL